MITNSAAQRRGLLVLFAAAAGLATAACGPVEATADPVPTAQAMAAHDTVVADSYGAAPPAEPTAATLLPGPPTIAVSYPDTAKGYAEAVIKAWKQDKIDVLGSLTTPEVQEQILQIPEPLNDAWTYLRCDGTAGSSYCTFANADGDEFTLRISHALLGQPHAATDVMLDLTEYPGDGVEYVKEFVAAWQIGNTARMLKLSKPSVVDELNKAPLNPSYPEPDCCGGGLLQVKVQWTGSSVTFDVGTTLLGGAHAIVGYTANSLTKITT